MVSIHEGRTKLSLNGTWKYKLDDKNSLEKEGVLEQDYDFSDWKNMNIPNNWYLTEVGDYFGTVWFQTKFNVPAKYKDQKIFLRFGAVDYFADVWLNGEYLGSHEGMFNPFEFDVTNKVNYEGSNVLIVKDGAPKDETEYIQSDFSDNPLSTPYKKHQAKAITQIKGHMIDAMHRPGAMTKFRQDGNSGGVWDDVELVIRPDIYIDYAKIFTRIEKKKDWLGDQLDKNTGNALVSLDITIVNTTSKVVNTDVGLLIESYNFKEDKKHEKSRSVTLQPGINLIKMVITVEDAKLWWTWDHGFPNMYTATVKVVEDSTKVNFGIKEVVTNEKTGEWFLNGKKIFLRGMRYISSLWMSEANEDMWKADLEKMLDMDINSIRIGSHMEKDGFYTMCDEMGLLLWQVFPLHYCVSDSEEVIEKASEMIRDMGLMLCNHACLGMWSVYKEPEIYALQDKPNNYFRLCEILKETLATVDPVRWIHKGDYREGVQNLMIGCCQDAETDLNKIKIQPNIVEFGAQSIPCLETLKTFIPEDKLWPPHWDTWEYWGLFYDITFKNAKIELGNSLEEFIDNYQTYEAIVVKEQIEALRQRKYKPVSTMYLYYWSDACAMIGSGLLDYYRRPYMVYDYMKSVYTQVLISLEWNADPYIIGREKFYNQLETFTGKVWVNNDHFHKVQDIQVSWKLYNKETGAIVCENSFKAILEEDSAEVVDHVIWQIPAGSSGHYRVDMSVSDKNGHVLSKNYNEFTVR